MSSRTAHKQAARQARIAAQANARRRAVRRTRVERVAAILAAATAAVALAIALSGGTDSRATPGSGGKLFGASLSSKLLAGIPQRGIVLGRADAPVRLVEFADLQCPYCDEYAVQALPTLIADYVRAGKVQMQFENLSFIGPDSVKAARVAAAAAQQNRLWNFIDLVYLNQGRENSGYVTASYVRRLLAAIPGLNEEAALRASATATAGAALARANQLAQRDAVNATPTFLLGRAAGALRPLQPTSLSPAPFEAAINALLSAGR